MIQKNLEVTKSIEINAEPAKIWDALTNPEKIKIYLFGTETISDWKEGSPILFRGEYQGQKYEDKGTITRFEPMKIFQYTYLSSFSGLNDEPGNYSLVTFRMEPSQDKVILTVTQSGFDNEEAREHSNAGWEFIIQKLIQILEAR